jgi:hypothetical protein
MHAEEEPALVVPMILGGALLSDQSMLDDFQLIARLACTQRPLYIRYSEGPVRDREGPSTDYESGLVLPGLSVTQLNPPAWWTLAPDLWVARRICKYSNLMEATRKPRPWLLTGRVVDTGPDHEPLVVEVIPIAWAGPSVLIEAARIYRDNFICGRDSRSLPARGHG